MQGKVWGKTETVIAAPLFEAHRLSIWPRAYCSWHTHAQKWNAFLVLSGQLTVKVNRNSILDETILGPGEMTTVEPGVLHQFETKAIGCEAYEFYYTGPLSEDIIRASTGGRL